MVVFDKNTTLEEAMCFLEDLPVWDLLDVMNSKEPSDIKTFEELFRTNNLAMTKLILSKILYTLDNWHNKDDEESHLDIREKLGKLKKDFETHRHDFSKTYSSKPE